MIAAVLLVAAVGCSGDSSAPTTTGTDSASAPNGAAAPGGPSVTPTPDPVTSASPTLPPDPEVTSVPSITRTGPAATPTASAPPAKITAPATYSDGVTVRVVAVKQSVNTQRGPGEIVGLPKTSFELELANKSGSPVDVGGSVVSLTYGSPQRLANPVYDSSARDFSGTVATGATATATYLFSIPTDQLSQVKLTVDFGGRHVAATFEGAAR